MRERRERKKRETDREREREGVSWQLAKLHHCPIPKFETCFIPGKMQLPKQYFAPVLLLLPLFAGLAQADYGHQVTAPK